MKPLNPAEWENLKNGAKYLASIVFAVVISFVLLATIAGFLGYTPSAPSSPEATALPQSD